MTFATLRGKLIPPVSELLPAGRAPTARKGVFLRAREGEAVRAVAAGRVVYADWMGGLGNLLIVDHGDAYLSIYGIKELLVRQPGDSVLDGETVATVGLPVAARNRVYTLSSGIWAGRSILFAG